MLRGRSAELAVLRELLARASEGRGGAVVIRGEAGTGKTALLESMPEGDVRLLRASGVESEAELPYAGLQVLLGEVLGLADRLPGQQARALRGAVEPPYGVRGDRFLVGAATLTLLSELAADRPVVVLVDDAHWLDLESAETLLFAARRLGAERVAVVFATRDDSAVFDRPGVPVVQLGPLGDDEAAVLLADRVPDLHASVRRWLLSQARGNPLALVELAGALTPAQRDGSEPLDDRELAAIPVSRRVRRIFDDKIRALGDRARSLLTIAAADDTGDLALVVRAGERTGTAAADLAPAADAGLILLGDGRVRFRHPLVRAAAYQGASLSERAAAHLALAGALPAGGDAARRAWHLAAATAGYDEGVAAELESSAESFRSRGGLAAVAAAYRRAAQLTQEQDAKARRLTAAALAASDAGQLEHAAALADAAAAHVHDPARAARLVSVRADLEHAMGRPEAARMLLVEAARLDPLVVFKAMAAAWDAPNPAAAAADTAARLSGIQVREAYVSRGAAGLCGLATGDLAGGAAALREFAAHVAATRGERGLSDHARLQGWELLLGDYESVHEQAVALDRECREQGALGVLPRVLLRLARCRLFLGRHRDAYATAVEGLEIARDTRQHHYVAMLGGVLAVLAAIEGDEQGCLRPVGEDPPNPTWHAHALGLLDLGRGRYESASHRLGSVTSGARKQVVIAVHSLPDQVEAAARLGGDGGAREACDRFERWAAAVGTPWARAVALRCRALLAPGEEAGPLFEAALAAHAEDGRPFERARTRLLHGEWLRRAKRRGAAREALGSALEAFERMRATPWAERARSELRAIGASPSPAPAGVDQVARLTAQELQVVRLAAAGLSNRDIGARLFISPRTVGYHLSNAYPKLGVSSRAALARLDLS
ncbi:helix-turn-helix transcriptional regulator [Nonomuraea sediminis]|uniref:helix-turn-helix transcriptional regulator n=1 Tax=Nonomuraea sediminis TaxID=2835864 RepID=UPI001BDC12E3|nr:helix-turn-helix transcriptional regulator [Nonomuraea sediminis]